MEQGRVEVRFTAAAAITKNDVTDHVFPFNVRGRGGVALQPPAIAAINDHFSDQKT